MMHLLINYLFGQENTKEIHKILNSDNKNSFTRIPNLIGSYFLKLFLRTVFENTENTIVFLPYSPCFACSSLFL